MIAKILNVKGRVQRVGYRRYVLENARALELKGYIKNELDDSVTIFIQGDEDSINRFIDIISNPPRPIIIKNIDVKGAQIDEDIEYFTIKYGELAEELQEGFGAMEAIFYNYWDEFREYRKEFRDFAKRTDDNFKELKASVDEVKESVNEVKISVNEVKASVDDVKISVNEVKTSINNVKDSVDEVKDSVNEVKDSINGLRNDMNNNFHELNVRYGEISDRLTTILEELRKDREEANKRFEILYKEILESKYELKKSIDALLEFVRAKQG